MRLSDPSRWLIAAVCVLLPSNGCALRDVAGDVRGNAAVSGGAEATAGGASAGGSSGSAAGSMSSSAGTATTPPPKLVTSAEGAYWTEATWTEVTSGTVDVTVSDSFEAQTFTGFGGAFNERGWEALSALSESDRDRALRLLFDAVDGANFAYGRIPIGASDYAMDRYTLDDAKDDLAMSKFSIERDKQRLIPYIKAALAVRSDIHFSGCPWTPPPWMKDINAYDRGGMKDDANTLKAFALYLAKFVEEYGKEGIAVKEILPQNEPGYRQDYPSCVWTAELMAKFIGSYLGPTFKERSVSAEIFLGSMSNGDSGKDNSFIDAVTRDSTATSYVKGYGLQWDMLAVYPSLNIESGLPVWQTEHQCGNYPWKSETYQSKAPNDHTYGVESWGLIRDWLKKGVNAYLAWNMVLDTVGKNLGTVQPWAQNALLTVDTPTKKLNITPAYYVFRHVSQYVVPGAKVVGTTGGDALAFKNPDGSIIVVMYNAGSTRTSIVAVSDRKLQFTMPGSGWATVYWKG